MLRQTRKIKIMLHLNQNYDNNFLIQLHNSVNCQYQSVHLEDFV